MPAKLTHQVAAERMRERGLEPTEPYPGSTVPWSCVCIACGTECAPYYNRVVGKGLRGCPVCARAQHPRRAVRTGAVEAERLWMEMGLTPLVPFPGVAVPWRSICDRCSKEVSPRLAHVRAGRSSGCRFCSGHSVDKREAAERLRERGYEPLEEYSGDNKAYMRLRCRTCGDEWSKKYNVAMNNGCATCSGTAVRPDRAEAIARANGFEPLEPFPGSDQGWLCRCMTCQREIAPRWHNIRHGSGCMRCAGKILDPDTASERLFARGFEPLEPYPGNRQKPWKCRCRTCGMVAAPKYSQIMRGTGIGCCGGRRDLRGVGKSAGLYVIAHTQIDTLKIGVGFAVAHEMRRVQQHRSRGWVVEAAWTGLPEYRMAVAVEQAVIRGWRLGQLPPRDIAADYLYGGVTETVALSAVRVSEVVSSVRSILSCNGWDEMLVEHLGDR